MKNKEFFDLLKIKKQLSDKNKVMTWREFLLLIANKKS